MKTISKTRGWIYKRTLYRTKRWVSTGNGWAIWFPFQVWGWFFLLLLYSHTSSSSVFILRLCAARKVWRRPFVRLRRTAREMSSVFLNIACTIVVRGCVWRRRRRRRAYLGGALGPRIYIALSPDDTQPTRFIGCLLHRAIRPITRRRRVGCDKEVVWGWWMKFGTILLWESVRYSSVCVCGRDNCIVSTWHT